MYLIIGLGNPGLEYDGTRHNIGFAVVDAVAAQLGLSFKKGLGDYQIAISKLVSSGLILVKPTTYMNRSGQAVKTVMKQYIIEPVNIVVVTDDFHLPLGSVRLRQKGSAGGHNGLTSVIEHLGTNEFARIRCGIESSAMPKDKEKITEFVLGRFRKSEQAEVKAMIDLARDAAIVAMTEGFHKAMNKFNSRE
ncbi:MAG: aminoacyl-tRNA hydrolase [Ignavibacteriae bacterium]|nr:aminoacyl-tRNA hydrolase [Ignavibacteriota bacterium]